MKTYTSHSEKLELIKNGSLSLKENVEGFLSKINEEKEINAFNFIFDEVIEQAGPISEKIKNGTNGKLAGMVIAVKDLLAIKDKPLTCSSKILKDFTAVYNSTVVQKLIDEDAIIIGKTNCDEFAMGSSNENSAFGNVLNPINKEYVPGGSSGGSAAAVAAGLCDLAIGTDTGGSIRQPASFTGIYGLKPTYGRVSRFGLTAYASSFDTIGPMSKSIEDIALVLSVISGNDENDSTSSEYEVPLYHKNLSNSDTLRIGVPKEYFTEGLESEIRSSIEEVITKCTKNNFEIVNITLPFTEYTIATYYILTTAEASSNLERYDGARYGHRSENSKNLQDMFFNSRSEGFGEEVQRRIMLGTYVLSSGYYDAYYKKAQQVRRLIKNDFDKAFNNVDLILTPTSPTTAFKIGEKRSNPLEMYLMDIYTTSINLAGIPAINIPIGFDSTGLPIGMQLITNQFEEQLLLQGAYRIKQVLNQ